MLQMLMMIIVQLHVYEHCDNFGGVSKLPADAMRVLPNSEDPYTGDETSNWPIEASGNYAHGMRSSQAGRNALRLSGQQHHSHPAGHG